MQIGGTMNNTLKSFFIVIPFMLGCAGIKVVNPADKNDNKGTLALDYSDGQPKLVNTYTCKLNSMGKRFSAVGKTEEDTRKEVLSRCRDATVLSFCKEADIGCEKN